MLYKEINSKTSPNMVGVHLHIVDSDKKPIDICNSIQSKIGSHKVNKKWNQDFQTKSVKDIHEEILALNHAPGSQENLHRYVLNFWNNQ